MRIDLDARLETLVLREPFTITGYTILDVPTLCVTLRRGAATGRGEAAGVYYKNDTVEAALQTLESLRGTIETGITRQAVQALLPPGAARNALDCALWELDAREAQTTVWQLAGLAPPQPLLTTFTIGAGAPDYMAATAATMQHARAIKLKLLGDGLDAARVAQVREARPDVWLGVDANQGFDRDGLLRVLPGFEAAGVALIEQPFKVGCEADMDGLPRRIPFAADESVQSCADLAALPGRFDVANIKLDKSGGLTEALAMVTHAQALGLRLMVGNMVGTSWAMAPGFLVGQACAVVDLDGPTFLREDRTPAITYRDGLIHCPDTVWGSP